MQNTGSKKKKTVIVILIAVAVIAAVILLKGEEGDFRYKYENQDLSVTENDIGRKDTYELYLAAHEADPRPQLAEDIQVPIIPFEGNGEEVECQDENGQTVKAVKTTDRDEGSGVVTTWTVDVPEAGMYNVQLKYLTVASRGVDIEREMYINGEIPFSGARTLTFTRLWTDKEEKRVDNQQNEIRPQQAEMFGVWQTSYCRDDMGYEVEPYQFYFRQGQNTISLKVVNEPVVVGAIVLSPVRAAATYEDYLAAQPQVDMSEEAKETKIVVQGEESTLRSSPSLYARYDRSSPATVPYSVDHTVLNYIGGDPWTYAGQWIQWDFEVPEDGYYNITIKARQMYQRGALSGRTVYIDGQIPFEDMNAVTFAYSNKWDMRTLADENGTPFRFYLAKGSHTIRLEVTMGEMGPILKRLESSIYRLNQVYRKILVLTGPNPDRYRDYSLDKVYPEALEAMKLESMRLYQIVDDTVATTGQKSDRVAAAQTLAVQLEQFVESNERITESFSNFKDNITSLGTAMQNMSESKLDVDLIMITGEKASIDGVNDGFLARLGHEVRSLISSYFVDYNSLGNKYDDSDEVLEVWIITGRDQSTIMKTMVDDSFTPETGIKVNVKLVAADAILTAVVAGNGPDVVITVDGWFAVNYAMRNAAEDLTQFPDFEEVIKPFYESAIVPLTYDDGTHKGVYGLPETQNFTLLFYRTDVMEEMGLEVPQTWDDLIAMLPTLQGDSLTVGIPFPDINAADISMFNTLIYQNGGVIYDEEAKKTLIDNEAGVAAFKLYTSLYNDYGLPMVYDFVSRFRSGEMPLGVAYYNTYNTLMVSAPEIRGLWDFTLVPGTVKEDGTIDRSVHSNGTCCLMVATDDESIKQMAWEFMKWWVSTDSQVRFGREMESVLGASARYQTANTEALRQLAWSADQLKVLEEQMSHTVGFREIAGGYSTTRHITNAIRHVINTKKDAREALMNYARTINEEIRIKRREFNLPID